MKKTLLILLALCLWHGLALAHLPSTDNAIALKQCSVDDLPLPERIAYWARHFVGVPYDPDPMGAYVSRAAIVADDQVDCMYHVFRSTELAMGSTPEGAVQLALDLRFKTKGVLGEDGKVLNYADRFEYGMDMLRSGKWGSDVTTTLGAPLEDVPPSRGHNDVKMVPVKALDKALPSLRTGDIAYLIKNPSRRVVGEIVGHMGVIERQGSEVYLIHASGSKKKGGAVTRLPLSEYLPQSPFVGMVVGRFEAK